MSNLRTQIDTETDTGSRAEVTETTAEHLQLPRGEALISALVLAHIRDEPELARQPLDTLLCRSIERAARVYGLIQETNDTPPVLRRLLPHAHRLIEELRALAKAQPAACRSHLEQAEQRHHWRAQERAADVIAWCIVNEEIEAE
jgi:hypothetical protein